jgi:hypothetical protein
MRGRWLSTVTAVGLFLPALASAQTLAERGFAEARLVAYPQAGKTDGTRLVGDVLFRQEASWKPTAWLSLSGAFDARTDTHDRVERAWRLDWSDRGQARPSFAVRRASATVHRGPFTMEAGKQFIRWGKADILNPTDRFAPRDFMEVVDNDFLGVTSVRTTWERGPDTLDAVWTPRFTPSRMPVLSDRWAGAAASALAAAGPVPVVDLGASYPERPQAGIRWNRVAPGFEFSLSAYDGYNHLPSFKVGALNLPTAAGVAPATIIQFHREYPRLRMFGADAAIPLRWFTLKGEAAHFVSPDRRTDDYGIYVLQVERQTGEWILVGGYAGEWVSRRRLQAASELASSFAPDRGLAGTLLGRASYTIDVNRSVAFEGAARRNGNGGWLKAEYSQAAGQHLRATLRLNVIRGADTDFFGQYRRNSNVDLLVRYSF